MINRFEKDKKKKKKKKRNKDDAWEPLRRKKKPLKLLQILLHLDDLKVILAWLYALICGVSFVAFKCLTFEFFE